MSASPIDRLESQMEALIEGLFTRLFQPTINARDVAVLLLRAMAEKATAAAEDDSQPIAPDTYTIVIHPESFDRPLGELAMAQRKFWFRIRAGT